MLKNDFTAAMTSEEFLFGEDRHSDAELSRRIVMVAGLTKSSEELAKAWGDSPELFLTTLSGAIGAYEDCKNIEELLLGCLARLVSVVNEESDEVNRAIEIIKKAEVSQPFS
jgi:hypothetical protein